VELVYTNKIILPGDAIGMNDDYDLTAPLARFLEINQDLIPERLQHVEEAISNYRRRHRKESRWKNRALTYQFLSFVHDQPQDPTSLAKSFIKSDCNLRLQQLIGNSRFAFETAYERLTVVSRSGATTWWYIFWVRANGIFSSSSRDNNYCRTTCGEETMTRSQD
jgi:hypothetical protein